MAEWPQLQRRRNGYPYLPSIFRRGKLDILSSFNYCPLTYFLGCRNESVTTHPYCLPDTVVSLGF